MLDLGTLAVIKHNTQIIIELQLPHLPSLGQWGSCLYLIFPLTNGRNRIL